VTRFALKVFQPSELLLNPTVSEVTARRRQGIYHGRQAHNCFQQGQHNNEKGDVHQQSARLRDS
jgi:hypothetical protein